MLGVSKSIEEKTTPPTFHGMDQIVWVKTNSMNISGASSGVWVKSITCLLTTSTGVKRQQTMNI